MAPVNMFSGFNVDPALITRHLRHGSKTPGLLKVSGHVFVLEAEGKKTECGAVMKTHHLPVISSETHCGWYSWESCQCKVSLLCRVAYYF